MRHILEGVLDLGTVFDLVEFHEEVFCAVFGEESLAGFAVRAV